jgi:hypothetical protein
MNDFSNPNLINEDVINSLTEEQLIRLAQMLEKI